MPTSTSSASGSSEAPPMPPTLLPPSAEDDVHTSADRQFPSKVARLQPQQEPLAQQVKQILGDHCTVQRVDKSRKVVGSASPEELGHCMQAEQRRKWCLSQVENMQTAEELVGWMRKVKDEGNKWYYEREFKEAALLYKDCLAALERCGELLKQGREISEGGGATTSRRGDTVRDSDSAALRKTCQDEIQIPVTVNLAACVLEMGKFDDCVTLCDLALGVDANHVKSLVRRGIALYRLREPHRAKVDLGRAIQLIDALEGRDDAAENGESFLELRKRAMVYYSMVRTAADEDKQKVARMFPSDALSDVQTSDTSNDVRGSAVASAPSPAAPASTSASGAGLSSGISFAETNEVKTVARKEQSTRRPQKQVKRLYEDKPDVSSAHGMSDEEIDAYIQKELAFYRNRSFVSILFSGVLDTIAGWCGACRHRARGNKSE